MLKVSLFVAALVAAAGIHRQGLFVESLSPRPRNPVLHFEQESLTPDADGANRIVDEFLAKLKAREAENDADDGAQCGYEACNVGQPGMLNVHMVPHSHDDVGWLRTVDEYFYGDRISGVQYILDTVLTELSNDPLKRFIYVEIAFFARWWNELHDQTRHLVRGLVTAGRLEFILGGWCMNDEASTHYSSIIDQHTVGFRFLKRNFGECGRPRIGWQIDPFGHSREQASLFAQFGFDGLFFARIDYQDYEQRKQNKTLEHVWMGSESLGDQATLFTGALYGTSYSQPPGFCFQCGDEPIMDDPDLENYNVDRRVNDFLKIVDDQAKAFATNHIMLTMGSDFQYENAHLNFKNLDKLIKYVNDRQVNGSKVNAFYSTPSCYLYAMNRLNLTYASKKDDFFPYAHRSHSFWTGYFTSRPALKGYERSANNFLQVCKQLETLSQLGPEYGSRLKVDRLRESLGVLQHHDAVSGTERQHVADDYAKMVARGMAACEEVINSAYGKLLPLSSSVEVPSVHFCPLMNVSICPASEGKGQFVVVIYNPIARETNFSARVPVSGAGYKVLDQRQQPVTAQVVPLPVATLSLPEFEGSKASGELVFKAKLPPLGFTTYFVQPSSDDISTLSLISGGNSETDRSDITIKNEFVSLTFGGNDGLLKGMTNLKKNLNIELSNQLLYYKSHIGNNSRGEFQASGAYVFRSDGSEAIPIGSKVTTSVIQGSEVQEVRQTFGNWATQVVRLYTGSEHVEMEWTVGPIPVDDKIGKEVISRFATNLKTKKKKVPTATLR